MTGEVEEKVWAKWKEERCWLYFKKLYFCSGQSSENPQKRNLEAAGTPARYCWEYRKDKQNTDYETNLGGMKAI